jgi:hypothetical protein
MRKSSVWVRVLVMTVTIAGLLAVAVPAHALQIFVCNGAGTNTVTPGTGSGVQTWVVTYSGQCNGDAGGPYRWSGTAFGTSTGAGLCEPGLPLTNDFALLSINTLTSQTLAARSRILIELWTMPLNLPTTYPLVTPFTIAGAALSTGGQPRGTVLGAGAILNRIFLNCAPSGSRGAVTVALRIVN